MGYHNKEIVKGEYGAFSKIQEELEELSDAIEQRNKIMQLIELSDLLGAIEGFLEKNFVDINLHDLVTMKNATKNAFKDGARKAKDEKQL